MGLEDKTEPKMFVLENTKMPRYFANIHVYYL